MSGYLAFDEYSVKIILDSAMLATNPGVVSVLDQHIQERQKKIILDKNKVNSTINKYRDALVPTDAELEEEKDALFRQIEEMAGRTLTPEERAKALAGDLKGLMETFESVQEGGTTVFFRDEAGMPCIARHMITGFLKAAAEAIYRTKTPADRPKKGKDPTASVDPGKVSTKGFFDVASTAQSILNQHVAVREKMISLSNDIKRKHDGTPDYCDRSLRTKFPARTCLARSEQVVEGTTMQFTLRVLAGSPVKEETLHTMFSYGQLKGLGQWRNGDNGQFHYELTRIN